MTPRHRSGLILCDNEGVGRITVGLEAFFEFSFWLAEELQDLVAQHRAIRPRPHAAGRSASSHGVQ